MKKVDAGIRHWKISYKINAIIIMTTLVSLFCALSGIVVYDHSVRKKMLAEELMVLSAVTAQRSVAALQFFDKKAAEENLKALKIKSIIQSACLYDKNGAVFSYTINKKIVPSGHKNYCDHDVFFTGVYFSGGYIEVMTPIMLRGETIGYIFIQASLKEIKDRLQYSITVSIVIMLLSLLLSLICAIPLQQKFIQPIIKLRGLAMNVSRSKDFSSRIDLDQRDEIGDTAQAFNTMLSTVEEFNKELYRLAFYDTLTELRNRKKFLQDLELTLVKTRYGKQQCAIIFLDVDRLKSVNDDLGHDVGDQVLVSLAQCIHNELQENALAYRLGGDEMALILRQVDDQESVVAILDLMRGKINKPWSISGHIVNVTTSMGVAMSRGFDTMFSIMKRADLALYEAKARGQNSYHFADEYLHDE